MKSPQITHTGPTTGILTYWLARIVITLFGWDIDGELPAGSKFLLIGAPHTSNWDFIFMLATSWIFRLKISFMAKDSLFRRPFGWLMRGLGGIPIDRASAHGVVEQVVARFSTREKLVVVVTPGGTRRYRDHWKSGFYWIAIEAQVPLLCASINYRTKRIHLGLSFIPTGELLSDMDRIRAFYAQGKGLYPHQAAEIRLQDEAGHNQS